MKVKRYVRSKPIFRFAVANFRDKTQIIKDHLTREQAMDYCQKHNWYYGDLICGISLCIVEQNSNP